MDSKHVHAPTRIRRLAATLLLLSWLVACNQSPVEQQVPSYTLTALDGSHASLQSYRGKLLVLNVWATWCPPCRKEMPSLELLSKSEKNNHIAVIGITIDQSLNAAREFVTQYGITFPVFTDTPGNVANLLDIHVYPETLLISADGRIVKRIVGERDWNSQETLQILEDIYQGTYNDPN